VPALRSIVWIGSGERFAAELASEAPTLEIVWEPEPEGARALPLHGFDAVVIDVGDPGQARLAVEALREHEGVPPLLVRTRAGDEDADTALRIAGAADVLASDPDAPARAAAELVERLEKLARARRNGSAHTREATQFSGIVGRSAAMREVFALIECAARSRATVLVTGETGTGKELVARAIHDRGAHPGRPFVAINCAAFPDTLLESELFGHMRGSFTGAERDKKGLFETADRGTLFLDEVSETSGPFQAKLLRVLQEREVRPVGGAKARRIDVRVIAATNRDLWSESLAGSFRDDLYYRLAVFPIPVPPLRSRPGDLPLLAEHFLALHGRREGKRRTKLCPEAVALLQAYRWPGNVRELENEVQRALALAEPGVPLGVRHFSRRLSGILEPVEANLRPGETLRETLGRIEAWLIRRALAAHDGSRTVTARHLAITREGLYKKMKRFGIE
jgi:transcriptional regulator with GAF, ATPase, and Fis domain